MLYDCTLLCARVYMVTNWHCSHLSDLQTCISPMHGYTFCQYLNNSYVMQEMTILPFFIHARVCTLHVHNRTRSSILSIYAPFNSKQDNTKIPLVHTCGCDYALTCYISLKLITLIDEICCYLSIELLNMMIILLYYLYSWLKYCQSYERVQINYHMCLQDSHN